MSTPTDEAQREAERLALRKVRLLVDYFENTDEADAKTQRRLLLFIIVGALVLALAIAAAVVGTRDKIKPVEIDVAKLPPVRAGPQR